MHRPDTFRVPSRCDHRVARGQRGSREFGPHTAAGPGNQPHLLVHGFSIRFVCGPNGLDSASALRLPSRRGSQSTDTGRGRAQVRGVAFSSSWSGPFCEEVEGWTTSDRVPPWCANRLSRQSRPFSAGASTLPRSPRATRHVGDVSMAPVCHLGSVDDSLHAGLPVPREMLPDRPIRPRVTRQARRLDRCPEAVNPLCSQERARSSEDRARLRVVMLLP